MRAVALVVLLSLPLFAQLPDGASTEIRVQEVKGEVEYQAAPKTAWKAAQVGDLLPVGTKLCTGVDSGAVLAFGTNSIAMVRETSVMQIKAFAMQGDQLVAQVMIDPGVCSVSVKQLATFQTDFQVSTPRLTASVRGSGETITANGGTGDRPDDVHVDEDFAEIVQQSGQSRGVAEGGGTDSNNSSPDDKALTQNIVDAVTGLADNEQDPSLLAAVAQNIGVNAGDLNGFGANPNQNLSPGAPPSPQPTDQTEIVLTWYDSRDLDAHYLGRTSGGSPYEVYFGALNSPDNLAHLDMDVLPGPGSETLTIDQHIPTGEVPNTYFVDNYPVGPSGNMNGIEISSAYWTSSDTVKVQVPGASEQVFNANAAKTERYWIVFDINVDSSGCPTIAPRDEYTDTNPGGSSD